MFPNPPKGSKPAKQTSPLPARGTNAVAQPPAEPDFQGRLSHLMLSDILQLLSFSNQTGTLTLTQGWNSRTISFRDGRICYIAIATKLPSVGELLVRSGKISEKYLQLALERQKITNQRLGVILLDAKLVTPEDLKACQDQQLEETVFSLFLWRNCHFSFHNGIIQESGGLAVDLASERLIMEGSRRVDEWARISPIVPSVRMIFNQVSSIGLEKMGPKEQQVFSHVNGRSDVVSLAELCGMTQFDTSKALYELGTARLVKAVPPSKPKIIELFKLLVENIYLKLSMFGYAKMGQELELQLRLFSREHGLKVRMSNGRVVLDDLDVPLDGTALIDLYKLFVNIQLNKLSRDLPLDIVNGLVQGLYNHADPDFQHLMRLYDFYNTDGVGGMGITEGLIE